MRRRRSHIRLIAVACFWLTADVVRGQEPQTREEEQRQQREEKAGHLVADEPRGLERGLLWLENGRFLERLLSPPEGIYPKLGTVTPGSGFALGPGYRRPGLFGGGAEFSAFAVGSIKKYWMIDGRLAMPQLARGAAFADVHVQSSDFPSEDFFGLGTTARREDQTKYGVRSTTVGAGGGVRPAPWLSIGGTVDHLSPRVRSGEGGRSIEEIFAAADTPGFGDRTDFMRYAVYADANFREPRGNPRRGGKYMASFQHYDDLDLDRFSFRRFDVDLQQYVPFLDDRRVIAVRGLASLSDADTNQDVPFYFQRTLGGPDDLRGFRRYRFRDRNLVLVQVEYRWEIFTAVDGAIFYDAGKVAARREDLTFRDLDSDYGIGFRFGTNNGIFLRVEAAFGSSDGKHFVIRFGNVF
jgi:hypothetical protein